MKLNYEAIFELFPEAQIETDNDGQIIIYTGMEEGDSDAGLYFMDRDEKGAPANWIRSDTEIKRNPQGRLSQGGYILDTGGV